MPLLVVPTLQESPCQQPPVQPVVPPTARLALADPLGESLDLSRCQLEGAVQGEDEGELRGGWGQPLEGSQGGLQGCTALCTALCTLGRAPDGQGKEGPLGGPLLELT